jgi:hypothetical protein
MKRLLLIACLLAAGPAAAQLVPVYNNNGAGAPADTTPPTPIPAINIAVTAITDVSANLRFISPGDDAGGGGNATSYDVRCVASSSCADMDTFTEFNAATDLPGEPPVEAPGDTAVMSLTSLTAGTDYVCRIVVRDEVPNPPIPIVSSASLSGCEQFTTTTVAYAQNSRNFDGVDDKVTANGVGTAIDRTYTHCAWERIETVTVVRSVYAEASDSATNSLASTEINTSGQVFCTYRNGSGSCPGTNCNQTTSAASINDAAWHYVCCMSDGANLTAWIDGAQSGAGTGITAPAATNFGLSTIGALARGSTPTLGDFFDGDIAHVQAWSVAITTGAGSQMETSMATPGCATTNLVHYWEVKGASPELDVAPGGTQDSTGITGTTSTSAQPATVTSDCEN